MIMDKYETFLLNISDIHSRRIRAKLQRRLKEIDFIEALQTSFQTVQNTKVLAATLPKNQLPYLISFINYHNFNIYQIVNENDQSQIYNINDAKDKIERFEISIDGLHDPFVKDKLIEMLNVFQRQTKMKYTFTKHAIIICTTPQYFSKLIKLLSTRHIDILHADTSSKTIRKRGIC